MVQTCIWVLDGLLKDDRNCGNEVSRNARKPCPGICVNYELDRRVSKKAQWRAVNLDKRDCSALMLFHEVVQFVLEQENHEQWRIELADPADAELAVLTELSDEERMVCGEWRAICEQATFDNDGLCATCDIAKECEALAGKLTPKKGAKVKLVQKQVIDISPVFTSPSEALAWLKKKAVKDENFNQGDWFMEINGSDE